MPSPKKNFYAAELGEEQLTQGVQPDRGRRRNATSTNSAPLPGQERYIAEVDEQGLGAVDAVQDESAPSSQWGEAWKYLRRRPLFWVSAALLSLIHI